ncbi:2958_t:CDS:2 [Gigaspora margarita]|uniref:2958_t:CDS:1 n=1 Tax=Gigaspora margarita TaxID=4874 RepID=A0ABN7UI70_GIGMA|nr:2958_t:CDS:2 [Gigaspora margarita]
MLSSQPKIPEDVIIKNEMSCSEKGGHVSYILLQCIMGCKYRNNHKITDETRKRIKSTKCQTYFVTLYTILNENAKVWLNEEQKELDYIMLKSSNNDTTMQLLQKLEEHNYIVHHLLSIDGYIRNLFFTYIEAAHYTTICSEVLIVDMIYKLILINAVGVSDIGNAKSLDTYQIAIAWVENEKEHTYKWFLNTLKEVIYDAYFCSLEVFVLDRSQALQNAANKVFPEAKKMLLAYAEEIKEAFGKVKNAAMKTEGSHGNIKKAIEAASGLDQLVRKISKWAIDQIKREICETEENNNTNNSVCKCRLQLNFKLLCHQIIPSTGLILFLIIHSYWLLKHEQVPLLPLSLSTDTAINKTLYMLEEKYENLNDSGSKATFLKKLKH